MEKALERYFKKLVKHENQVKSCGISYQITTDSDLYGAITAEESDTAVTLFVDLDHDAIKHVEINGSKVKFNVSKIVISNSKNTHFIGGIAVSPVFGDRAVKIYNEKGRIARSFRMDISEYLNISTTHFLDDEIIVSINQDSTPQHLLELVPNVSTKGALEKYPVFNIHTTANSRGVYSSDINAYFTPYDVRPNELTTISDESISDHLKHVQKYIQMISQEFNTIFFKDGAFIISRNVFNNTKVLCQILTRNSSGACLLMLASTGPTIGSELVTDNEDCCYNTYNEIFPRLQGGSTIGNYTDLQLQNILPVYTTIVRIIKLENTDTGCKLVNKPDGLSNRDTEILLSLSMELFENYMNVNSHSSYSYDKLCYQSRICEILDTLYDHYTGSDTIILIDSRAPYKGTERIIVFNRRHEKYNLDDLERALAIAKEE